jgi:hypothetical protein
LLIKTEEEEEKEGGIEARHTLRVGGLKFGTLSDFARSASKVTYRKKKNYLPWSPRVLLK